MAHTRTKDTIISIIGWYGVVATILAYFLVSFSLLAATSLIYQLLNLTGALGVTIETWVKRDYQPFWLNLIWAGIAAVAIVNLFIHIPTTSIPSVAPISSTEQSTSVATSTIVDGKIILHNLQPGSTIHSPLMIQGEAPGSWYFEASFPIMIVDWDGKIIGEGHAQAQGDWMTTGIVPFTATITFNTQDISGNYSDRGTIIFKKDNPSGLSSHDDAVEMPITIN